MHRPRRAVWLSVRHASARFPDRLLFLRAGRMLMGANDGGVDEQLLHVGITTQHVGHAFPDAAVALAGEANVGAVPELPNSGGRSRHGLPVRMIQSTASTKRRLSLAEQPGSLALPGNRCSIHAQGSSRSIFRFILALQKSQDMTIFRPL